MNKIKNTFVYGVCILCLMVSACSTTSDEQTIEKSESFVEKKKKEQPQQTPVEQLYRNAATALDNDDLVDAARLFDEVEREYPYSKWSTRAQLMSGYAHYKNLSYDEAILALNRFVQLHPGDENIAYAYYLRALCYYEQISDVRRDQKMTALALDNLLQVTQRYPQSKYARDASLKIDLTLDHLAGKEMEIGRYYLIRGHSQAAINRFQKVIDEYQTTSHVPEALHRLAEAYTVLGITSEARKYASILGHNFPNNAWYKDSYILLKGEDVAGVMDKDKTLYSKTLGRVF